MLFLISIPVRKYYLRTGRDIKRLDAVSKRDYLLFYCSTVSNPFTKAQSPVFGHIAATFEGLDTVRAFGLERQFEQQYLNCLGDSMACRSLTIYTQRLIGFVLDMFALVYICSINIMIVLLPDGEFISEGMAPF